MARLITVVSKHGCSLCEKVESALQSLALRYDLETRVVYIDDDSELHGKYWLTIPVVQVYGKDIFDARHLGGEANVAAKIERLFAAHGLTNISA